MSSKDSTTRLVSIGVSSAVQRGLISALGIPPEDFFQIIHVLPRSQFRHTPSFVGLAYSADLILLEVTFIARRPTETRPGLLKALNDGVVPAAGISPDDLVIVLYETASENVSFGCGLAQRARIPDSAPAAAYADRA
jgi:hypothetical protein